jgi:hypothetical protein
MPECAIDGTSGRRFRDFVDAYAFVARFATGLRAGDAHGHCEESPRQLLTLDRGMLAAKMLGISASHGIRLVPSTAHPFRMPAVAFDRFYRYAELTDPVAFARASSARDDRGDR